jgi:hypothetical protein
VNFLAVRLWYCSFRWLFNLDDLIMSGDKRKGGLFEGGGSGELGLCELASVEG